MTGGETARGESIRRWVSGVLGPAGVGAGVTVLASLIPFVGLLAPAIGGGVASQVGAPDDGNGPRVGLVAGAMVVLLSLPVTFLAVAAAATVSPAATVAVLGATLVGAGYVVGSSALGGYLADEFARGRTVRRDVAVDAAADTAATAEPPVERLKRRYVDGEIDDAEFERRLERLVAAEEADGPASGDAAEIPGDRPASREDATAARER